MLSSVVKGPKVSTVKNTITSEVVVDTNYFNNVHFELDTFVNQDEDLNDKKGCGQIDFSTLMDIFRDDDESDE